MATVPYTGVPQVSPTDSPIPRDTVQASPEMFGATVGNALQSMGKTEEGVGNEIFARGIAMQDLYNHSEAQDADARYMQKAGELHANFSSLQGKAAVDAYPQYIEDLKSARKEIGEGLSNSMSQKLYDAGSLSTMGRTVFNGAGHAATQNKQYAIGASTAKIQAIGDQVLSTPADDGQFQQGLAQSEQEVRAQGDLHGWSPEQTEEAVAQNRSNLYGQRIQGLVKMQPFTAGKMLQDGINSGAIRGQDIAKLTNLVQGAQNTVGARQVSHQVMTGANNQFGEGPIDIKLAATAIKQIESGGTYSSTGVETRHGHALGAYQVMSDFLPEFLQQAGMPPMTEKEFLSNSAAQDQLFATRFGGYMKQTGSFNDAASMWLTGKPLAQAGNVKDALGTNAQNYVTRANAALAQNAPLADKVAMGQKLAASQSAINPLFPDYVRDRIEADANKQMAVKRDDDFQNRSVIETALMGGQDGKLPTTVDELMHGDPKTADAWDRLQQSNPAAARRYMDVLTKNSKGDHGWTAETMKQYQGLYGMAQTNPAEFVDQDIISTNIPNNKKLQLIQMQQKLYGKSEGDPGINRALQILQPDLGPAGINRKTDKDGYDQFVGALADQVQDFMQENKRPPKVDEVKKIGSQLMRQQHSPEFFFNSSTDNMFKLPVPQDVMEETKRLNPNLTDEQIQREYIRKKYQKLYGGTPSTQAAAQ